VREVTQDIGCFLKNLSEEKNEGEGLLDWRVEVKRELKLLVGSRMTLMLALE
jgi:hypothetical protein